MRRVLVARSYFDGEEHHHGGPYRFLLRDGMIEHVLDPEDFVKGLPQGYESAKVREVGFVMPGLVEAHAHLFLDGNELDLGKRSAYLKSEPREMLVVAQKNLQAATRQGITLVRDAGDIHGINHQIRDSQAGHVPHIRSPGTAIRRQGRYGGFMAVATESETDIEIALNKILPSADDLKVLLTGIIDFEAGEVKGAPQFSEAELRRIQRRAGEVGKKTFVHCSGAHGLDVAIAAGVDSIEHGFFMQEHHLEEMARKQIAWVPTLSPVQFQADQPSYAGWSSATVGNINRILDSHRRSILQAHAFGVPLIAGSDAGSMGVGHGTALIEEIIMYGQAGLPVHASLKAATTTPRTAWGEVDVSLRPGSTAQILCLALSPFDDIAVLRSPEALFIGGEEVALT